MADDKETTITISMSRKVNLGNYSSADCFVSISGIKAGMTVEELTPLIDTGKVGWELVKHALTEKVREIISENAR